MDRKVFSFDNATGVQIFSLFMPVGSLLENVVINFTAAPGANTTFRMASFSKQPFASGEFDNRNPQFSRGAITLPTGTDAVAGLGAYPLEFHCFYRSTRIEPYVGVELNLGAASSGYVYFFVRPPQ